MNTLEFVFKDGWHFIGSAILLAIICSWRPFTIDKSVNTYNGKEEEEE